MTTTTPTPTATTTPTPTPRRAPLRFLALAILTLGLPARALPPGQAVALRSGLEAGPGPTRATLALEASRWLAGEVDALVGLRAAAAAEPADRGAGPVTPWLGLRWTPGLGRWRPGLEAGAGLRLPRSGRAVAPVLNLGAGLERLVGPRLALCAGAGGRFTGGAGLTADLSLGVRLFF